MTEPLLAAGPDFDQPIAVLKHCHDKIRKNLQTLQKLLGHLPQHGAAAAAQQAATNVLRYFREAAPNHHADEEDDLLPMLQATAAGEDKRLLDTLLPQILHEHEQMDLIWITLSAQLQAIVDGAAPQLAPDIVEQFSAIYTEHMNKEESHVAPMAKRLFDAAQMQQLGQAMRTRRHIAT
jgi:hemerythrin-like domain-containing protein